MKVVISVCTFAAAVLAVAGAPAFQNVFFPDPSGIVFRDRRSAYGGAYASPCGAQLPLGPAGGYQLSPVHAGYGYGGGHAAYAAAPSYGYAAPHYRADEAGETEILNFSDMEPGMTEHMPMARYGGYGAAVAPAAPVAHAGGYGGQLAPAVASGPAYGVFPNANVGGCNVPLLLSCSPSIVPGRLVKSSGYGGGYGGGAVVAAAGNAYRGVDDQIHQDLHEEHAEEMTSHDSTEHVSDTTHTDVHQ